MAVDLAVHSPGEHDSRPGPVPARQGPPGHVGGPGIPGAGRPGVVAAHAGAAWGVLGHGNSAGRPPDLARHINADDVADWTSAQYGPGPYPVVVVGSASGAAVHLAAALRAPYLPQTTLVAVRELGTHPDDARGAMDALAPTARLVAQRNPEVAVYHMHDPAQDRPMLEGMAYLRLKRRALGRTLERFLEERLMPGGTVLLVECTRTWRTRAVGERVYFQFGCLGGVPEEEYHSSGARIADYLARERSPRRRGEPPEPDARRPEAGGRRPNGASTRPCGPTSSTSPTGSGTGCAASSPRSRRISATSSPTCTAGGTAGGDCRRSGCLCSPTCSGTRCGASASARCRSGSASTCSSFEDLQRYLDRADRYDHIHLNLFSQGLWSPGVVPVHHWRALVESAARVHGEVIGVDEHAYPLDTGSTMRYQPAFAALPPRHPLPAPLDVADIDRFLETGGDSYRLTWR